MGLSFLVLGNPVAVAEKRDSNAVTSAQNVVNTLQTQTNSIVAQISA